MKINNLEQINADTSITNEDLDMAVGEILFSCQEGILEDFEVYEAINPVIMKSGTVFPTCKEGFMSKTDVNNLMSRILAR